MKWIIVYNDLKEYHSDNINWNELPSEGVQIVWIIFPNGSRMQVSGWDFYVLEFVGDSIRVTVWKDADPVDINGNPIVDDYAGMFSQRTFSPDNTGTKTKYQPVKELPHFPAEIIKAGKWVSDDIAKQLKLID